MSEENTTWTDSLPEGFKEAAFFKGADSPEAALTAIENAASHMGNSIRFPGEDASPEAKQEFYGKVLEKAPSLMPKPTEDGMDAFYASIGRPEKAEGYNFEVPEGRETPPDFMEFSATAHKYGLTQDQFKGVLGDVLGAQWTQDDLASSAQKDEMQTLNTEWGATYEQNMTQVKNFLRLTDAPEGIVDLITEGAMSPTEIKWMHALANSMKSTAELSQQPHTSNPDLVSPAEAKNKIQEMLNNAEHPFWVATDPRHMDARKKMVELQQMAMGKTG